MPLRLRWVMIFFGHIVPYWTNLRPFPIDCFEMAWELMYNNCDSVDKAASPVTFGVQYQRVLLELSAP